MLNNGFATEVSSIDQLEPGDVIAYSWDGGPVMDHVAVYTGNGTVAGNTTDEDGWDWKLGVGNYYPNGTIKLLHITGGNSASFVPPDSVTINGYDISGPFYSVFKQYQNLLGNPTSSVIVQGDGTSIQYFDNGYIFWDGQQAVAYYSGNGIPVTPPPDNLPDPFDGNYDRNAAVAYARKYADYPNPEYQDQYNNGGDCTNFVSQALIAGGALFLPVVQNNLMTFLHFGKTTLKNDFINADKLPLYLESHGMAIIKRGLKGLSVEEKLREIEQFMIPGDIFGYDEHPGQYIDHLNFYLDYGADGVPRVANHSGNTDEGYEGDSIKDVNLDSLEMLIHIIRPDNRL